MLAAIVVSGAAVRLTGSGLGCPDWPNCDDGRLVAPIEKHALVEFTNRTITGLVSVAVILAVLGSIWRVPRRRDLIWLSWGLVAGVVAQIVLGGVTVLVDLSPPFVMAHFLLSMALLADAVVLHDRASQPDGPRRRVVAPEIATAVMGARGRGRARPLHGHDRHRQRARTAATSTCVASTSSSPTSRGSTAPA